MTCAKLTTDSVAIVIITTLRHHHDLQNQGYDEPVAFESGFFSRSNRAIVRPELYEFETLWEATTTPRGGRFTQPLVQVKDASHQMERLRVRQ